MDWKKRRTNWDYKKTPALSASGQAFEIAYELSFGFNQHIHVSGTPFFCLAVRMKKHI